MDSPDRHRVALTLQYDGGSFFGWQLQPDQRTVQGDLERVLSKLLNAPARVLGSGRTDRGVHATGQVATVDTPTRWTAAALRRALNALLPQDIWVSGASVVSPDFHPRYDALSRSYVYRVGLIEESQSPFHARWCWPLAKPVDLPAMQSACRRLIGDHSFRSYAKAGQEERGDRCIVQQAFWAEWGDLGLEFHITANRFLHHMVRYLVGTMVEVGVGRRPVADVARLLQPEPEMETSPPAPPEGLFLREVLYPEPPVGPERPAHGSTSGLASHF